MAGRKIKDAKDARACLSAAKASGLTNAEWARGEGIDGRSLHAWQMNLSAGPASRSRKESSGRSRRTVSKSAPPWMVELVPIVKSSILTRPRYAVPTLASLLEGIALAAPRRRWYRRRAAA